MIKEKDFKSIEGTHFKLEGNGPKYKIGFYSDCKELSNEDVLAGRGMDIKSISAFGTLRIPEERKPYFIKNLINHGKFRK